MVWEERMRTIKRNAKNKLKQKLPTRPAGIMVLKRTFFLLLLGEGVDTPLHAMPKETNTCSEHACSFNFAYQQANTS